MRYSVPVSAILISFLLIWQPAQLFAQKTEVEILKADLLEGVQTDSIKFHRLAGSVKLRHKDVLMFCDSALLFGLRNTVFAFGNVQIRQGDSLTIIGDSLTYKGNRKTAALNGHVVLSQNDLQLATSKLNYNTKSNIAYFHQKAFMRNATTTLECNSGKYESNRKMAYFSKNVMLKNKNYEMFSDTLQYHTEKEMAYFFGPTKIISSDNTIHCERGWYNMKSENALFSKNVHLSNPPQTIEADSLRYNRNARFGEAFSNILWTDSVENTSIYCHYATYFELLHHVMATRGPVMANVIDNDTLFLTADTIRSKEDTTDHITTLRAYYDVVLFKSNLQGVCDSMTYSSLDSVMWFYGAPALWSDSSQFTADTISVKLKNDKLHKIRMNGNAFLASRNDTLIYNQIKGRTITGHFSNDTLRHMLVDGNGESVYWAQDDKDAYMGVNQSTCSRMKIFMKSNKVDRILFMGSPEATLYPMKDIKVADYILDGFEWRGDHRPGSKAVLFSKYEAISNAIINH